MEIKESEIIKFCRSEGKTLRELFASELNLNRKNLFSILCRMEHSGKIGVEHYEISNQKTTGISHVVKRYYDVDKRRESMKYIYSIENNFIRPKTEYDDDY